MFYKIYNLIYILIIVNWITLNVNKTILCAISFISSLCANKQVFLVMDAMLI